MKAILMSIRPQYVAKILNGEKTIEVRKKFPKDYVGWVYIYCTKDNHNYLIDYRNAGGKFCITPTDDLSLLKEGITQKLNGKVVARFWCDKVEEIENKPFVRYGYPRTKTLDSYNLTKYSCVDNCDIKEYLAGGNGYAIHITKLEIFDKPKEIYEMKRLEHFGIKNKCKMLVPITRAPQSWQFIEV